MSADKTGCPKCVTGSIQETYLTPPDKGKVKGCNRCSYFHYDPYEVDWGALPPEVFDQYTNACEEVKNPVIVESTPKKKQSHFEKLYHMNLLVNEKKVDTET